jgi:hypothetical protein
MWVEGESGANGFNPINLHWTVHPERNQQWRDEQTRVLGIKGAAQECDCLWGDSKVQIKNLETMEVEYYTLEKLYDIL